jgi:hypothetical protein
MATSTRVDMGDIWNYEYSSNSVRPLDISYLIKNKEIVDAYDSSELL